MNVYERMSTGYNMLNMLFRTTVNVLFIYCTSYE